MKNRTQDPEKLNDFLEKYERYVHDVLKPTQREICQTFEPWQEPVHWEKHKRASGMPIPTPIHTVFSRIKRPEQVVDKILRQPENFPSGLAAKSFRTMGDSLGVRTIVYFLSHLPLVDRELRESTLFDISETDPPFAYMSPHQAEVLGLDHIAAEEKESGYCAIHYALRLRDSTVPKRSRPYFELQVRTLGMDLWSTMEHQLGYKPGRGVASVAARRQLKILSQHVGAIDEHFSLLYEELYRYQQDLDYRGEDPLDPANLPAVLGEAAISCAQRDINNILKFLYSRGVETVDGVRTLATSSRLARIKNTYMSAAGRMPTSLELVASLAALRGAANASAEAKRIKAQIAYRGAWDSIRGEFTQGEGKK